MNRILTSIFLCVVSISIGYAQNISTEEKNEIKLLADKCIEEYKRTADLRNDNEEIDIRVKKSFLRLFETKAFVANDLNLNQINNNIEVDQYANNISFEMSDLKGPMLSFSSEKEILVNDIYYDELDGNYEIPVKLKKTMYFGLNENLEIIEYKNGEEVALEFTINVYLDTKIARIGGIKKDTDEAVALNYNVNPKPVYKEDRKKEKKEKNRIEKEEKERQKQKEKDEERLAKLNKEKEARDKKSAEEARERELAAEKEQLAKQKEEQRKQEEDRLAKIREEELAAAKAQKEKEAEEAKAKKEELEELAKQQREEKLKEEEEKRTAKLNEIKKAEEEKLKKAEEERLAKLKTEEAEREAKLQEAKQKDAERLKKIEEEKQAKQSKEEADQLAKQKKEEADQLAKQKKEEADQLTKKNKEEEQELAKEKKKEEEQLAKERKEEQARDEKLAQLKKEEEERNKKEETETTKTVVVPNEQTRRQDNHFYLGFGPRGLFALDNATIRDGNSFNYESNLSLGGGLNILFSPQRKKHASVFLNVGVAFMPYSSELNGNQEFVFTNPGNDNFGVAMSQKAVTVNLSESLSANTLQIPVGLSFQILKSENTKLFIDLLAKPHFLIGSATHSASGAMRYTAEYKEFGPVLSLGSEFNEENEIIVENGYGRDFPFNVSSDITYNQPFAVGGGLNLLTAISAKGYLGIFAHFNYYLNSPGWTLNDNANQLLEVIRDGNLIDESDPNMPFNIEKSNNGLTSFSDSFIETIDMNAVEFGISYNIKIK